MNGKKAMSERMARNSCIRDHCNFHDEKPCVTPFLVQKSDTKVPEKRSSLLCYELVLRSQEVYMY